MTQIQQKKITNYADSGLGPGFVTMLETFSVLVFTVPGTFGFLFQ